MQKKLLALAVASAIASPVVMADTAVYGTINLSIDSVGGGATSLATNALATDFISNGTSNLDGAGAWAGTNVAQARGMRPFYQAMALSSDTRTRVTSGNSFLGIKGSEKINDDLSAVYQWEFSVNFDQQDTSNLGTSDAQTSQSKRSTFAGLASKNMGTFALGLQDTPLKTSTGPLDVFGNTVADYRAIMGAFNGSVRAQNSVMYTSPSFVGIQAKALYGAGNETGNGDSNYYFPSNASPHVSSFSLSYTGGPAYVVVAKERNIQTGSVAAVAGGGNSSSASPTAAPTFITGSGGLNSFFMIVPDVMPATSATQLGFIGFDTATDTTRAGLGLKFGGFKAGLAYEKTEAEISATAYRPTALNGSSTGFAGTGGVAGAASAGTYHLFSGEATRKAYYLSAGYTIGSVTVMGAYGKAKDADGTNCVACGNDTGSTQISGGVVYSLSKNTSLFGVYTTMKNEDNAFYSVAGGATGVAGVTAADIGEAPRAISMGMKTSF